MSAWQSRCGLVRQNRFPGNDSFAFQHGIELIRGKIADVFYGA